MERDISARRYPRKDAKGNLCAVIMVRSSEPNLSFAGNINGNIEYDNATYMVYMPAGSTQLTVSNGGKNSVDLKFGALASASTYETIILETADKGSLSLTTNPSGAEVFLIAKGEKISLGRTPIKNTVSIKAGTYHIEITKQGYKKWKKENIKISNGKITDLGKIKLKAY